MEVDVLPAGIENFAASSAAEKKEFEDSSDDGAHFFTEEAAMKLSFAVFLAVANKWRGVRMDVFTARKVEELRNELLPQLTSEESAA